MQENKIKAKRYKSHLELAKMMERVYFIFQEEEKNKETILRYDLIEFFSTKSSIFFSSHI